MLMGSLGSSQAQSQASSPPKAAAVQLQLQARLFRSGTGSLSEDVLASGGADLVNVVAAQDPSIATLVVVAVKLAPDTVLRSEAPVRLKVTETAGRGRAARSLLDRTLPIGAVARGGTAHLGFWVQGTGCRPLQLQASLVDPAVKAPAAASASLPFACGE